MIHELLYKIKLLLPEKFKEQVTPFMPKSMIRSLKQNDYFVVSFPKCGRSWLKLIICDFVYFEFSDKERIDDVSTELLYKVDNRVPRIIFTHDQNPMYKTIDELNKNKSNYKHSNIVFLVRDPRDVMVSWFYEYKYRVSDLSKREDMMETNLSEFLRNDRGGLPTLVAFYNIWVEQKEHVNNFMILKYEDLRNNSLISLTSLTRFLGIEKIVSKSSIEKAIDKNTFKKVQERELQGKIINGKHKAEEFGAGRNQALKARKGKVGGYKEALSKDDIEWANSYIKSHLHPAYGYH